MSRLTGWASRARRSGSVGPADPRFEVARTAFSVRRARLSAVAGAILIILAGCGHSSGSGFASTAQSTKAGGSAKRATSAPAAGPPASSTSTASDKVTGSSGLLTATMRAGTHKPKVGRSWPVHFRVTRAGAPAKASVGYEFLLAGQVVARRSHYTFTGSFSDIVVWPSQSVGYPLTFRAVIVSEGATIYLDYPVQVTR